MPMGNPMGYMNKAKQYGRKLKIPEQMMGGKTAALLGVGLGASAVLAHRKSSGRSSGAQATAIASQIRAY